MFLMPWILFGGFLAGIPVVIHLLHRQKIQPIAWGAMQFLLESPLKIRRRKKIDNWLLMLVRMAILAILVVLLARPVLKTTDLKTNIPFDVAVVIDHSMTMGMRTSAVPIPASAGGGPAPTGQTLYEQGVDVAEKISRMLPSGGTMSIVLAEHSPRIVTASPVKMGLSERSTDGSPAGQWAADLNALHKLKPGTTKGNIAPAVAAARDLVSHGNNTHKWILVISDQQRTNWDPGNDGLWKLALGISDNPNSPSTTPVYSYPITANNAGLAGTSATPLANISVRGLLVMPAFVGVHRPSEILATVANSGGTDLSGIPLTLSVDGHSVASQELAHLAPGESATARFDYYFPDPGSHWIKVESTLVDALDADNAAYGAINVWPKLRVLVVDGALTAAAQYPQAAFLQAAMQPVDPAIDPVTLIDPRIISVSKFTKVRLEDYPVIILNDVPRLSAAMVDQLAARAQAGNGVWIILGPRTENSFINDVLAKSPLAPIKTTGITHAPPPPTASAASSSAPAPIGADIREPANPAVELLTDSGEHSALADVTLRAWWNLTPLSDQLRTIISTTGSNAQPIVLETPQGKLGGHCVIWSIPTGNLDWSNLPLVSGFVPLVNETLFHLASGQDVGEPRQVDAGAPLVWTGPASRPLDSVTLVSPDGARRTLQPELRGDHYFVQADGTDQPGLYQMQFLAAAQAGATRPPDAFFAVNIDPAELDPAILSASDLDAMQTKGFLKGTLTAQTLANAMNATQGDYDLWWLLAVGILLLLLLETWMTRRLVRQQSGAALAQTGLADVLPAGTLITKNQPQETPA